MKVKFVRDCDPIPQTDNERYRVGEQADLRGAQWLIENGYAVSVDGKTVVEIPATEVVDIVDDEVSPLLEQSQPDLNNMTMAELRVIATQLGAEFARRKSELIANIEAVRGKSHER